MERYRTWNDHVSSWWEKKQTHPNLHCMLVEDLVEDTGRELEKLCSFLDLCPSGEENGSQRQKVGDWKNHFTVAQNQDLDED